MRGFVDANRIATVPKPTMRLESPAVHSRSIRNTTLVAVHMGKSALKRVVRQVD
jgi:hypothetical protein